MNINFNELFLLFNLVNSDFTLRVRIVLRCIYESIHTHTICQYDYKKKYGFGNQATIFHIYQPGIDEITKISFHDEFM